MTIKKTQALLYHWLHKEQKDLLLNVLTETNIKQLLYEFGVAVSDLQTFGPTLQGRSVHEFRLPAVVEITFYTTQRVYDSEMLVWYDRIEAHTKIPEPNSTFGVFVLRSRGIRFPITHYKISFNSLYVDFSGTMIDVGYLELLSKDLPGIERKMVASIENTVKFQPTKQFREKNALEALTVAGIWKTIRKSSTWKQLKTYCSNP